MIFTSGDLFASNYLMGFAKQKVIVIILLDLGKVLFDAEKRSCSDISPQTDGIIKN